MRAREPRSSAGTAAGEARCERCIHFRNDPAYLETVFAGLVSLGSGYGSARAEDGVCGRHDRYLSAQASCADFSVRETTR
jgi:hypothetical protein